MDRRRIPPWAFDAALVLCAAAAGSAREIGSPGHDTKHLAGPVWVYVAAQLLAAGALLWRRSRPHAATLTIAALSLLVPAWAAILAPYAVVVHGGVRWRSWAVLLTTVACWLVGARAWAIDDPFSGPLLFLLSTLLGLYVRSRRQLVQELTGRAHLLAEQARADERLRLAGEMHDVVTHRINLMVLQAGALRVASSDPAVRTAAEELRVAGCQALAELRDVVGVLRTPRPAGGGPRRAVPDPGSTGTSPESALTALVEDSRAAGLPVRLAEEGDAAVVAPTVRRTLYRVVQESLTNALKHAPGSTVDISVHYGPDGVRATVRNTKPLRAKDPAVTGGGSGLAGLRHRVEVVGGTLAAGSTVDGGFAVRAALPVYVPTGTRP
ncbi:hypothetical protein Val02_02710 [Virgisporangium aliadipatigenens]|uniref:histidine kinase n=1 Tax=Virgisporangium aliadipatigenens TaxID=741659 RepID=A0A8J3YG10_9ACTN|nr:histidine kinase [Virgisporangium aliadipatigenens]GIJ43385.1 hypothetical protein Val02_02710 [Virgisporangium aliadipatigenens]